MRFIDLVIAIVWLWFGFLAGHISDGSIVSGMYATAGIVIGYVIIAIIRRYTGPWREK